ncbi:MAG: ATP-dependent helicase, partial [Cyclobacteriaceae bacterium]|nr:ATP-dependent helicase [Cyclobacteriaceae bacterium]
GASGMAISFCDVEEREFLRDIQKLIGKTVPVVSDHPFPSDGKAPAPQQKQTYNKPVQQQGRTNSFKSSRKRWMTERKGNDLSY